MVVDFFFFVQSGQSRGKNYPISPPLSGSPRKNEPPINVYPHYFLNTKSFYKRFLGKKLDRKISNNGRMASLFLWSQIFKIIRKILKIFVSAHMHARNGLKSCVHSYLCIKVIFYFPKYSAATCDSDINQGPRQIIGQFRYL